MHPIGRPMLAALALAAPLLAQAAALAEVRIAQLLTQPDGSVIESPFASSSSFSDGVADLDLITGGNVPLNLSPGGRAEFDFRYSLLLQADGATFAGDYPSACVPLGLTSCLPAPSGRETAWAWLDIGYVDARSAPPFLSLSGTSGRIVHALNDGRLERSGTVHIVASNTSSFSGLSTGFGVFAGTFAVAPVPEADTALQLVAGLTLLAGLLRWTKRPQARAQHIPIASTAG